MKIKLFYCIAVVCCLLFCGHAYCKNETVSGKEKSKIKRSADKPVVNGVTPTRKQLKETRKEKAAEIIKRIEECVKGQGTCGTDDCSVHPTYCTTATCHKQIFCCHEISEEDFDDITEKGTLGRARFTLLQFQNVVTGGDCKTEKIRCSARWSTYTIKRVDLGEDVSRPYKSYYSIPMMEQLIGLPDVDSIIMYKGTDVNQKRIIPLKVIFTNPSTKPRFFDLSGLP